MAHRGKNGWKKRGGDPRKRKKNSFEIRYHMSIIDFLAQKKSWRALGMGYKINEAKIKALR